MFDWEGRILDNKNIMMLKAALPYLDIPVGDVVDLEGLLRAIRTFCRVQEQKMIDMMLNFFMMKRVMSMMTVMNQMNQMNAEGATQTDVESLMNVLRSQMPKEQQDMFDMFSMMMSAMSEDSVQSDEEADSHHESGGDFQEYAPDEGADHPGDGAEGEGEEHETDGTADHGGDAETEGEQSFVFPGGGFGSSGDYDQGYEPGGETAGGDDEADHTESE